MRAALTQMSIDKLPISSSKVEHRDTRLKGLVLRVMPSGAKSYYCDYAMTLRYAHPAPEFKMNAVEVLDIARDAAMGRNKVLAFVK